MSDLHLGEFNCHMAGIQEVVDEVASKKNHFLINGGDSIAAILPNDKRWNSLGADLKNQLLTPKQQADAVIEIYRPAAKQGKIKAIGFGNHEYKLINTMDFGKYIAESLNVPYGGITYKFCALDRSGNLMHKFYYTHGNGCLPKGAKDPIQRKANIKAAIRRKLENTLISDCIVMSFGHTHQLEVVEPTVNDALYITDDGENHRQHYQVAADQNADYIPPDSRWYTNTGSFRKLYAPSGSHVIDYGEAAMYGPTELGCIKITVEDRKVVKVEKRKV